MGGTNDPKGAEVNFVGYLKEFRFWNVVRNDYEIMNGRFYDMTSKASFFAYWKFDEVNDGTVTTFTDKSKDGTTSFNPTSIVPS